MRLIIQPDYQSVSKWAAHYVAAKITLSVMRFHTTRLLRLENHQLQHFILKCQKQKYKS